VALQRHPVCFFPPCGEAIDHDPVYESPCGHEDHPSAVFHPICLMGWREYKEDMEREIKRFVSDHEARQHEDDDHA
jgi:hypothetical protein